MDHVVLKHKRTTLERADKFISDIYFTDVNLKSRLYGKTAPIESLTYYSAPDRITFKEAENGEYKPFQVGTSLGPTWSTHWFRLDIEVPDSWVGEEVHLLWNSNSEAMIWINGQPIQGLNKEKKRNWYPLTKSHDKQNKSYQVYIEMACNEVFGAGKNGFINDADPDKTYCVTQAEIATFDRQIYNLIIDVTILHDIAEHLPETSDRGYQALYTVNKLINTLDLDDKSTYLKAHDIAEKFFKQRNGDSQHEIHAMGHAHIDTAWLWPYAETIRKCARSWSSTIRLMEQYPHFTFTCSQAQQYEWVQQHYPGLFQQIKQFVRKGQFVPVGGTWVEMDGNIPSGESFVRQFLYGQRYFRKEFDKTCHEFWLPDTFGYSAQLPQIMRMCCINRFLTQKLSWSLVNKFPHHTFWWEGIDGSKVLAHFPPGDDYCMTGDVDQVLRTKSNYRDKGRSDRSVYLFGHGDGGHGPSEDMLLKLKRLEDVDGLPRVKMSTPDDYFTLVERDDKDNLCKWRGELYLELHNGTYTTQAKVKLMNRKCEFLLHDIEFLSSVAKIQGLSSGNLFQYPSTELLRLWKLLLLNQFHDVLPGSSIGLVYKDSHHHYKDIEKSGRKLEDEAVRAVLQGDNCDHTCTVVNTLGWARTEVVSLPTGEDINSPAKKRSKQDTETVQIDSCGKSLVMVSAPSCGFSALQPLECQLPAVIVRRGDIYYLENQYLKTSIDHYGRIIELNVQGTNRNLINSDYYGNQFVLYDDIPLFWDAWDVMDYHMETRKPLDHVLQHTLIVDEGPLRASVEFSVKISDRSYLKQTISLDAGCPYLKFSTENFVSATPPKLLKGFCSNFIEMVHWHENRKMLKVEFPTVIHTNEATYEIQYGHLQRPNHFNTSWDWARFEVCGHKWADLSEYGYGVALLNDSKYGFSTIDGVMRMSLLRSPKAPDAKADMGTHHFTYAVMPHKGTFQDAGVIQAAYNLNSPLHLSKVSVSKDLLNEQSYFIVDTPQVILETVKKYEDLDNVLVLRLYESCGGHTSVTLTVNLPFKTVYSCNGLEEAIDDHDAMYTEISVKNNNIQLSVNPFQIVTLLLEF